MAKLYATPDQVRWLRIPLRIIGWVNLISGLSVLITGKSNFLSDYLFTSTEPLYSALMGGALVLLDLGLVLYELPQRRERYKNKRAYRAACRKLPAGTGMAELNRQYRQQEMNRRTLTDSGFCRQILDRYPCREVLQYIHSHNPETAYMLSREILARGTPAPDPRYAVPKAPADPPPEEKKPDVHLTASRIDDLNALLASRKDEVPEGTPLKREDIQLGPMLDQYWHGCDYYEAATHRVMKYIAIPDGPQGFGPIQVPEEITTLEQLLPWLVENHDFHLKEEDE